MSEPTDRNEPFIDFGTDSADAAAVEPQYLTDEGIPMLFDVAVPGERMRRDQIRLQPGAAAQRADQSPAQRIEAAIADASPAVLKHEDTVVRNELLAEVQKNLETGRRNDDV